MVFGTFGAASAGFALFRILKNSKELACLQDGCIFTGSALVYNTTLFSQVHHKKPLRLEYFSNFPL